MLIELHRYQEARRELELLLQAEPGEPALQDTVRRQPCRPRRARTGDRPLPRAARGSPADAEVHLSIGHALKTLGQARGGDRRPIARRRRLPAGFRRRLLESCEPQDLPLHGRWNSTQLQAAKPRRRRRLVGPLPSVFRARQGARGPRRVRASPSATTSAATRSSAPRAAIAGTDRDQHRAADRRCARAEFFASRAGWGNPSPDPIFIVGLPRSGSTLLEQILASHSQVEGTQELPDIQRIVSRAAVASSRICRNPRYPRVLASLRRGGVCAGSATNIWPTRGSTAAGTAVLHRQDAEQLPAHRSHSPDAAERHASSTPGASRWPAASATSSSCLPTARSSPTASRTSPATTAPTLS